MDYPNELLPCSLYKLIESDLSDFFLIRHTETSDRLLLIDISTGLIKDKYIGNPRQRMIDLSTNLFGVFNYNHIPINITQEGKPDYLDYCEPDIDIEPPVFGRQFNLVEGRGSWTLLISNLQNFIIPYEFKTSVLYAECHVEHTPMKWNYWHFSVRWKLQDDQYWHNLDGKGKKNWSKKLAFSVRSHIRKFARIETLSNIDIDRSIYLKDF